MTPVVRAGMFNEQEKAAFLLGMVRAFECVGWPDHFSADDRATWCERATWATHMLTGGAFNPWHAWEVVGLVDKELTEQL